MTTVGETIIFIIAADNQWLSSNDASRLLGQKYTLL